MGNHKEKNNDTNKVTETRGRGGDCPSNQMQQHQLHCRHRHNQNDDTSVEYDVGSSDQSGGSGQHGSALGVVDGDGVSVVEKAVFRKARQLLDMGAIYRLVVYIYAERKLLVFFGIHFVSTMIIWGKCYCFCEL